MKPFRFIRNVARGLIVCAGVVLVAYPASAQTNSARQLQLQVLDAATHAPVPDVHVRAWVRGDFQTDPQGRCAFALPESHTGAFSYRIVLTAPGYVPEIVNWSSVQQDLIEEMPTNYTAHLTKAVSIGGVVKNMKGEPLANAKVIFSFPPIAGVDREKFFVGPNYHAERSGDDGRWTNNEVPPDFQAMTFRVAASDYVSASFGCAPSDENTNLIVISTNDFLARKAAMALGHGIVLGGCVVDPAGQPVLGAVLTKDYEWRNPATTRQTDANGSFELLNLRPGEMVLTVQSPDWAPQTLLVTLTNDLAPLTIHLKPGQSLKGRVLDESNQPISGARLELDRLGREPLEFDWSAETSDDGSFAWSNAPAGDHPFIIAASGFHTRSVAGWSAGGPDKIAILRHEKDGDGIEVDGSVTDAAGGAPIRRFTLALTEFRDTAVISSQQDISSDDGRYRLLIDAHDSAFLITLNAPGYLPFPGDRLATGDGDQTADFQLERGIAREVTGRLIVNNYAGWIDWTNQQISLVADVPKPPGLDSDDPATAERLMRDFLHTAAGKKWDRSQRPLFVAVDARGFFKIDGVAPGAHELRGQIGDSKNGGLIASLDQKIDVPEATAASNGPVTLSSVEITPRHDLSVGDTAPLFDVKALDGSALKLADFHGKYVLLDFWATWCGPCVGEMPNLKAAYDAFSQDPRFVMISLSLDGDPSAPRNFARKNGIQWRQGFLGEWSKTDVPEKYGVQGIPAIFLIGPDGKILEHDLRGPAISDAIKKALSAPN